MKKTFLTLITVFMVLSMLLIAAHAGPPTTAEGLWQYIPTIEDVKVANGNTFIYTTEVGQWTGTFEGDSTEIGKVVQHSSGLVSFKGTVSFVGNVGDKSGTLKMVAVGSKPDRLPGTEWEGTWVILSGTGDLANLRGHGTWRGPGWDPTHPTEWGNIYYSGEIHFDPE